MKFKWMEAKPILLLCLSHPTRRWVGDKVLPLCLTPEQNATLLKVVAGLALPGTMDLHLLPSPHMHTRSHQHNLQARKHTRSLSVYSYCFESRVVQGEAWKSI